MSGRYSWRLVMKEWSRGVESGVCGGMDHSYSSFGSVLSRYCSMHGPWSRMWMRLSIPNSIFRALSRLL